MSVQLCTCKWKYEALCTFFSHLLHPAPELSTLKSFLFPSITPNTILQLFPAWFPSLLPYQNLLLPLCFNRSCWSQSGCCLFVFAFKFWLYFNISDCILTSSSGFLKNTLHAECILNCKESLRQNCSAQTPPSSEDCEPLYKLLFFCSNFASTAFKMETPSCIWTKFTASLYSHSIWR